MRQEGHEDQVTLRGAGVGMSLTPSLLPQQRDGQAPHRGRLLVFQGLAGLVGGRGHVCGRRRGRPSRGRCRAVRAPSRKPLALARCRARTECLSCFRSEAGSDKLGRATAGLVTRHARVPIGGDISTEGSRRQGYASSNSICGSRRRDRRAGWWSETRRERELAFYGRRGRGEGRALRLRWGRVGREGRPGRLAARNAQRLRVQRSRLSWPSRASRP